MIDAACGGGTLRRPPVEIYRIMGDLASNTHQWASQDRQMVKKKETPAGMYHVDQQAMLTSHIEAINKKLEALILAQSQPTTSTVIIPGIPCNLCGSVSHDSDNCLITELLSQRAPGTLPTQPKANPRGEATTIKLRSGKEVENSDEKEVVIGSNPKVPTDGNSEEKEESSKNDKVEFFYYLGQFSFFE
ncbi:hypothetical protein SESBI_02544 [Sesbania bispinosa]|nr:hypothetical protein SESBI_02544 [Sesbania bispinosa]